jgi:predicted ATPase/class 3 adenylate cyclase
MRTLPSGTLTFFFSDIEDSTGLLETLGPAYPEVLERHRQIVRDAFSRSAGMEVGGEGDSFFAVFPSVRDAVAAAVAIQRAIGAEPWPLGSVLRVRIGLHTGEARVVEDDYVGLDVHRAARIMAAGHGGQILVSEATRTVVGRDPGHGIELRDLGEHRLRSLVTPERIFMVLADGLATDFPKLRTLDATPNNLPTQTSELIGRDGELRAIRDELASGVRLLSLTGPGGIGKTRLALHAVADEVERFSDGVYFVDLSLVQSGHEVFDALAQTVGVVVARDADLRSALAEHIRDRSLLVLLDNFEQVMTAAEDVAELLRRCPHLAVVVTSREALRVRGERLFPVAPLSVPDGDLGRVTAKEAAQHAAVRLFVARAWEVRPGFLLTDDDAPAVAEICSRLDGLPLAIELAAARLNVFSAQELRDRLGSRLDVLGGGARDLPARQRTLRSTIEWSYELLDEEERSVFQVLSVFSSSRFAAFETVGHRVEQLSRIDLLDRVGSLVDKSLVRSVDEDSRGRRLSMLDTIREYAQEQLRRDPEVDRSAHLAHAEYFANFAQEIFAVLRRDHRREAEEELTSELANLQLAWRHFVSLADVAQLNRLLDPLWMLYDARGWYHAAVALTNDLLAVLSTSPVAPERRDDEITLRISLARGLLALRGYTEEVEQVYRQALTLAEASGSLPKRLPVLRGLASFHLYRGEIDKTAAIGREMLELAAGQNDPDLELEGQVILGPSLALMGDQDTGLELLDRAIEAFDPQRHGRWRFRLGPNPGVAAATVSALLHWIFGYPDTAMRRIDHALDLAAQLKHPYSGAWATFHAGVLALWDGQLEVGRARAREVLRIAEEHEYELWQALGLVLDGVTTAALDQAAEGLAATERGVAMYQNLQTPPVFWPHVLGLQAVACALAGRSEDAIGLLDQAIALAEGDWISAGWLFIQKADLLVSRGDTATAEQLLREVVERTAAPGARMTRLRAATRLRRLANDARAAEATAELREIYDTFTEGFETNDLREASAALGGP